MTDDYNVPEFDAGWDQAVKDIKAGNELRYAPDASGEWRLGYTLCCIARGAQYPQTEKTEESFLDLGDGEG